MLAFATNNRESFEHVKTWWKAVVDECGEDLLMVLVQTKLDLIDEA